jgi:hypothetical protein
VRHYSGLERMWLLFILSHSKNKLIDLDRDKIASKIKSINLVINNQRHVMLAF